MDLLFILRLLCLGQFMSALLHKRVIMDAMHPYFRLLCGAAKVLGCGFCYTLNLKIGLKERVRSSLFY
jgi:hypothetical protein